MNAHAKAKASAVGDIFLKTSSNKISVSFSLFKLFYTYQSVLNRWFIKNTDIITFIRICIKFCIDFKHPMTVCVITKFGPNKETGMRVNIALRYF